MNFIIEVVQSILTRKPLVKKGKFIIDSTCIPADILYPTDIRLLERCRQKVLRLIKKAKSFGLKCSYRTYSRVARSVFVHFSKLSRPKEKTRRKVHKQMIQFVRRNLRQLKDLRSRSIMELGLKAKTHPQILKFLQELKISHSKIQTILHQQKQVYKGAISIPNRIVSFHKQHIRPIVRGKFPIDTEFGPKILVALYRGWTYVIDVFQNNVADVTMVLPAIRWFKKTFGRLPKELLGDRGTFSGHNLQSLQSLSIRSGLQARGKHHKDSPVQKRNIRQRLPIEARISLGKRMTGWGRCRAKNPEHESSWIRLDAMALNLHLAFFCNSP